MSEITPIEKPLTVLLDIRHPFSYLALQPANALAHDESIEIDWVPMLDVPLKPPSVQEPGDDRGIRHRRIRAEAIAREIEIYSGNQGLDLRDYYRKPDPSLFNSAWLWARNHAPGKVYAFLVESFEAYWKGEFDLGEISSVEGLLSRSGFEGERFAKSAQESDRDAWTSEWQAWSADLRERGLTRGPCYLIEDEVFVGRQHVEMIRWILRGRQGRGPI